MINFSYRLRKFAAIILGAIIFLSPITSYAQCSSPEGIAGEQVYNVDHSVMQFCDGAEWVAMGARVQVLWHKIGSNLHYTEGTVAIGTSVHQGTGLRVVGSGTIGGVNATDISNAWSLVGHDTNGIGFDDNEITKIGSELHIGTIGTYPVSLFSNGAYRLRIQSDGLVNIYDTLDVANDINVTNLYATYIEVDDVSVSNAIVITGNEGTDYIIGDDADTSVTNGIVVRPAINPLASGDNLFSVQSQGFSDRLRVEHDGYTSTSNDLAVEGGGSSYITGKLGIGTTSPAQTLSVIGSGTGNVTASPANLYIYDETSGMRSISLDTSSAYNPEIEFNADGVAKFRLNLDNQNNGDMTLYSHSITDEVMTWTKDGKVGIGTLTPEGTGLNVVGSGSIGSSPGPANFSSAWLLVGSTSQGLAFDPNEVAAVGNNLNLIADGSYGVNMITANESRMRITAAGNVGIGTTTPAAKLHSVHSGTIGESSANIANAGLLVDDGASTLAVDSNEIASFGGQISLQGEDGIRFKVGDSADGDLDVSMRVAETGNVGIGTETPSQALEVVGNIRASNNVDLSSGNGNGFRFWNGNDSYKISMGDSAEYKYGTITDYSIKMHMNGTAGRGWTWGVSTLAPIAALDNAGNFQVAGTGTFKGGLNNEGSMMLSGSDIPLLTLNSTGDWASIGFDSASATKTMMMNYGSSANQIRFGRYGDAFGDWEATPIVFDIDAPADTLVITNGGDIGVGTASPATKLDVVGNVRARSNMYVGTGGGYFYSDSGSRIRTNQNFYTNNAATYLYGDNTYLGDSSGDKIHIRANQFDWTSGGGGIINTSGNMGIGTTSPSEKLDVRGNVTLTGDLKMAGTDSYIWTPNTATGYTGIYDQYNSYVALKYTNGGDIQLLPTGAGNVGIGTETPVHTLDVAGSLRVASGSGGSLVYNGAADISFAYTPRGDGGRAFVAGDNDSLVINYGGDFAGGVYVGGTGTTPLNRIGSTGQTTYFTSGNFGIGTTTPYNKLTVGAIASTGAGQGGAYDIGTNSIGVNNSLYSYGYICAGNSSGACTGTGGVVLKNDGTITASSLTLSGALSASTATASSSMTAPFYNVVSGNGNGLRFWSSNSYKISMGNTAEYKYGPVTDYSIKSSMSNTAGRGWSWGVTGVAPKAAIGIAGNMQLASTMTASSFIDVNGTGYYLDPANTGNSLRVAGRVGINGAAVHATYPMAVAGGDSAMTIYGPNTTWGSYLKVGAGSNAIASGAAQVITTNGNLHLDAGTGQNAYINHYNTAGKTFIMGGNVGVGTTSPNAKLEVNGNIITTANRALPKIILDSDGTTGTDNWTTQGAQISLGESGDGAASLHLTYRGDGYGYIGSGALSNGIPGHSYFRFHYNSSNIYTPDIVTSGASFRAPIFYDSAATAYYLDPGNTGTSLNVAGAINAAGALSSASVSTGNITSTGDITMSGAAAEVKYTSDSGPHGLNFVDELMWYYRTSPDTLTAEHSDGSVLFTIDRANKRVTAPHYYDANDTNYLIDPAGTSYVKYLGRKGHNTGHLVGSYNSVAENSTYSNPIYVIGSAYNPDASALSNMYGIGYTHTNATFTPTGANGWGMYVAADGDARIFLSGSSGIVAAAKYVDTGNAGYFLDPAATAKALNVGGDIDVNDKSIYLRDTADNLYGIGFDAEGGDHFTIFSDHLISFTESDANVIRAQYDMNAPTWTFDGGTLYVDGDDDGSYPNRVGIATTTPAARLDVNGNIRVTAPGSSWITGKTGTGGINSATKLTTTAYHSLIRQTTSSGHVVNLGGLGDLFGFHSYKSTRVDNGYDFFAGVDAADNRFGIGTRDPKTTLHVEGAGITSSGAANSFRHVYGNYGSFWHQNGSDLYLMLTNSTDQYGTYNSFRPFRVQFSTGDVFIDGSTLFVDNSANRVGIGTTAPVAKVEVEGGGVVWNETAQGTTAGGIHLDPGITTDHSGNAITWGASDSSNGDTAQAGIYVRSDSTYGTRMYLSTTDLYADGPQTAMMIDEHGQVGIGTTDNEAYTYTVQVYDHCDIKSQRVSTGLFGACGLFWTTLSTTNDYGQTQSTCGGTISSSKDSNYCYRTVEYDAFRTETRSAQAKLYVDAGVDSEYNAYRMGIYAQSTNDAAIFAKSTGDYAIRAQSDVNYGVYSVGKTRGVYGVSGSTSVSATTYGTYGLAYSSVQNAYGAYGNGVTRSTESDGAIAYGGYFSGDAGYDYETTYSYGVYGTAQDGWRAVGVYGTATSASASAAAGEGGNIGVYGAASGTNGYGGYFTNTTVGGHAIKAGSGSIYTATPPITTSMTQTTSAPIEIPEVRVAAGGGYIPFLHQRSLVPGGYRQHLVLGNYRDGNNSWGGGFFIGLGGNDSYPTEHFIMYNGGTISHSSGTIWIGGNMYSNSWVGSTTGSTGGWRLGKWPSNSSANSWVYLSRTNSSTTYANMAMGDLHAAGALRFSSDLRLKKNVKTLENSLDNVLSLRGVNFEWKDKDRGTGTKVGFIAQEVEPLIPELVGEGSDFFKSVDYANMTPVLVEAIKEFYYKEKEDSKQLRTEIKTLKEEVKALKEAYGSKQEENRNLLFELEQLKKDVQDLKASVAW